jgi:NAD+ diphosphatase
LTSSATPAAPRREAVLAYSGGTLDRAANQRTDPAWVDAIPAAPGTRLIPMWRDQCVVSGDAVPVVLPAARAAPVLAAAAEPVFLGLDGDAGVFAADLSALEEPRAVDASGGDQVLDVRRLVGTLAHAEATLLGYARGMLHWNRHQRYCGTCGSPTRSGHGGHMRECQNPECARLHFPRVEPAVIMLVETPGPPRRCLLARHQGAAPGRYSTLAGFVDVSESLEDAVRREVAEETGVPVDTVTYLASQGGAQAGADRGILLPVGRGDHPHQRGRLGPGRAEPVGRAGQPDRPDRPDRGPARGPGRPDGGPDPRVRDRRRTARQDDPPADADGAAGPRGPAGRTRCRVRGARRESPAAQEEQPGRRRAHPGPVAQPVGIVPAVLDRRRGERHAVGEPDDPLEPR